MKKKIIAIDFDGTIVENAWPKIGKPMEWAKETINALHEQGHTIIIWTCRDSDDLPPVKEYMNKNNIHYDYINENSKDINFAPLPKIYYDILIDDRAINNIVNDYIDWKQITEQFVKLGIL